MGLVEAMQEKDTNTTNGAVTNSTTHDFTLDLFFIAGACRNESDKNLRRMLEKSYAFNRLDTLRIILWAMDIRQGAGERFFAKRALKWLYDEYKQDFYQIMKLVPEFSRWDVLFDFSEDTLVLDFICENLKTRNALLCKWLPRKCVAVDKYKTKYAKTVGNETTQVEKTKIKKREMYNGLARKIRERLGWTPKQYRKFLVENSMTVEQKMSAKQWEHIVYSQVPSVAMNKYQKAWYRNDEKRFRQYIEEVNAGKTKINASAIFPHDIVRNGLDFSGWGCSVTGLEDSAIAQWENLPNYLGDSVNSILPICDVSGSMYQPPLAGLICLSLGLYISERNQGIFKDAFITFSDKPKMQCLQGNINQRLRQLVSAEWAGSTNLLNVFDTILLKAMEKKLSPEEMPKNLLIISDMEFNSCCTMTNYEAAKFRYMMSGYQIPNIIFWNVNGRAGNCPITINDKGVALVSGANPNIIKTVLSGDINPVSIMHQTIHAERYNCIQ